MRWMVCILMLVSASFVNPVKQAGAEEKKAFQVVASIRPLHSLIAGVIGEQGRLSLLIDRGSPHHFALRPSGARALSEADLVFWIGPDLEQFLEQPLRKIASRADRLAVSRLPGMKLLRLEEGNGHHHEEHGHGHAKHEKHGHDAEAETDPHIWLDPANAVIIVKAVRDRFSRLQPKKAALFQQNADWLLRRLEELDREIAGQLSAVKGRPYLVFHNGYRYFEERYGLKNLGAVSPGAELQPGARHLRRLRKRIARDEIRCLFTEPQFNARLAQSLAADAGLRLGSLDPLGRDLKPGPALYFGMMRANAKALADCLKQD